MPELFDTFPVLQSDMLIIKKMVEEDVDNLNEITSNHNVYRFISPFLYKKSRNTLLTAIRNLGGRDFDKKKMICAGIYLLEKPDKLVGLAEMFDYKKKANQMTIGYRLNEEYWNRGIASEAAKLMVNYLSTDMGVQTLKAYVMPENIYSQRVLLKNGFIKKEETAEGEGWGGKEKTSLIVFSYSAT